ncbi:hypothetical protein [Nonlabens sp.]|uniref:hypothetical protein n=1 Tax=Nonlabens sp. TaxID=1888209 RepID=UPI003F69B9B0
MKYLKALVHILIVVVLTLVTQVGGVVWIAVFGFFKTRKSLWNKRKRLVVFVVTYVLVIFTVVPLTASLGNRMMLPIFHEHIQPHNLGYVLLCRNYVSVELHETLESIAINLSQPVNGEISITYLDAGFPFINGFPLLPHLSHNDGRKIDIAFIYNNEDQQLDNSNPSLTGYGVYVEPENGINPMLSQCEDAGYWQYGYSKYFGLVTNSSITINPEFTKYLIKEILTEQRTQKLFIEPHLIPRFELDQLQQYQRSKIRFHGCHAVRHDDHIHFQIH